MGQRFCHQADGNDQRIFEIFWEDGPRVAYPIFCQYYFEIDPTPKQIELACSPLQFIATPTEWRIDPRVARDTLGVGAIRCGKTESVAKGFQMIGLYIPGLHMANFAPSTDQALTMRRMMLRDYDKPKFQKFFRESKRTPFPIITNVMGSDCEFRSIPLGAVGDEGELIRSREWDAMCVDEAFFFGEKAIKVLKGRMLGRDQARKFMPERLRLFYQLANPDNGQSWGKVRYYRGLPGNENYKPGYHSVKFKLPDDAPWLEQQAIDELVEYYTQREIVTDIEGDFGEIPGTIFRLTDLQKAFMAVHDPTGVVYQIDEIITKEDIDTTDGFELPPIEGHTYISAWDVGKGSIAPRIVPGLGARGGTHNVVLDVTREPWSIAAIKTIARVRSWEQVIGEMVRVREKYWGAESTWDSQGQGDVLDDWAASIGESIDFPCALTKKSKPAIIRIEQLCFEQGRIKGPFHPVLFNQLRDYIEDDSEMPQDLVMTIGMGLYQAWQKFVQRKEEVDEEHKRHVRNRIRARRVRRKKAA